MSAALRLVRRLAAHGHPPVSSSSSQAARSPETRFSRHNGHEWRLTTTHGPIQRGDASVYRFVFVSLMMVVLVVASNGGAAIAASRSFAQAQAAPIVTELPTTTTSHPWIAWAPLANGYVEQEFRFTGMAGIYAYTSAPPPPWDLTLQDMQPYATRMLVRRPSDPTAFNGTVVVEWLNVTSGYDIDPVWTTVAQYFLRSGYAWVGVSAQAAGVEALKKWDPQRYGDLTIADDGQSYEIFSQAAQALRQPGSRILGGLPIQQIIGTGVSQSAMRLVPYIMPSTRWRMCTTAISCTVADAACHPSTASACSRTWSAIRSRPTCQHWCSRPRAT